MFFFPPRAKRNPRENKPRVSKYSLFQFKINHVRGHYSQAKSLKQVFYTFLFGVYRPFDAAQFVRGEIGGDKTGSIPIRTLQH